MSESLVGSNLADHPLASSFLEPPCCRVVSVVYPLPLEAGYHSEWALLGLTAWVLVGAD